MTGSPADLLNWVPPDAPRAGVTYNHALDYDRLNGQQRRVYNVMLSGSWLTLGEISAVTGDPEASVSSRLRDLRKAEFGGLTIERRRRGHEKRGLHEYRLSTPHT